jgi:hypothetical protein
MSEYKRLLEHFRQRATPGHDPGVSGVFQDLKPSRH